MREHKYKAKRQDNGEWVFGFYAETYTYGSPDPETPQDKHCWITEYCEDCRASFERHEVDPDTVCEYVGETTINPVPVFEGDVVRCISNTNSFNREVKYAEDRHKWLPERGWLEVVGNIHDNPELLEEAK